MTYNNLNPKAKPGVQDTGSGHVDKTLIQTRSRDENELLITEEQNKHIGELSLYLDSKALRRKSQRKHFCELSKIHLQLLTLKSSKKESETMLCLWVDMGGVDKRAE